MENKIAIITGGSQGIGAAISIEFTRRGAKGVYESAIILYIDIYRLLRLVSRTFQTPEQLRT